MANEELTHQYYDCIGKELEAGVIQKIKEKYGSIAATLGTPVIVSKTRQITRKAIQSIYSDDDLRVLIKLHSNPEMSRILNKTMPLIEQIMKIAEESGLGKS